jgi:hypothetical protein
VPLDRAFRDVNSKLEQLAVWACDFLQTHDVWFRPVFAFFMVDINTKQVVPVAVTRPPTAQWTAQQLREATPFGVGSEFTPKALGSPESILGSYPAG